MGVLSIFLTVVKGVWDMGGNLRLIYEKSADARQQAEDRFQTLQRVLTFGAWVVAVVSYEAYLMEMEEVARNNHHTDTADIGSSSSHMVRAGRRGGARRDGDAESEDEGSERRATNRSPKGSQRGHQGSYFVVSDNNHNRGERNIGSHSRGGSSPSEIDNGSFISSQNPANA